MFISVVSVLMVDFVSVVFFNGSGLLGFVSVGLGGLGFFAGFC